MIDLVMKNKIESFLIILCGGLLISAASKQEVTEQPRTLEQKAIQLKQAYKALSNGTNQADEAYFEEFPHNFSTLNALFGCENEEESSEGTVHGPGPLSHPESTSYIDAFFKLSGVENAIFYNRLADIGSTGRSDMSNSIMINYFRDNMQAAIQYNLVNFCDTLAKREDKEIQDFWFFYFNGSHSIVNMPEGLKEVQKTDEHMYKLMQAALHEVHQEGSKNK